MWKLGKYEIKGRIVLGPMAGFTSEGYRKFLNAFGVDVCVTEMVSDMGLIYNNKDTNDYVIFQKDKNALTGVQLFGYSPENLAKAARKALDLNPDIEFFDVNMGCPVPKVCRSGSGSALMKNPKLCGDIIRAIKKETNLPVTAKIRLGYDSINFLDVIKELEDADVDAITIHPRTRREGYSGKPHWDLVEDLQSKMRVPLIVSGNINSVDDALNALKVTGATAIMVARGGVGNPELVSNIKLALDGSEDRHEYTLKKQKQYCLDLAKSMIEEKGEKEAMMIYRSIAPKFFSGFANVKDFRSNLAQNLVSYESLVSILNEYEEDINNL